MVDVSCFAVVVYVALLPLHPSLPVRYAEHLASEYTLELIFDIRTILPIKRADLFVREGSREVGR